MTSSPTSSEGQTPFAGYPEAESPSRVLYAVHDGGIPGTGNPDQPRPRPLRRHPRRRRLDHRIRRHPRRRPLRDSALRLDPLRSRRGPRHLRLRRPRRLLALLCRRLHRHPGPPARRRTGPGHGAARSDPGPERQTRRLHRQGPLRQRQPLRLRLDLPVRARRQRNGDISIYDRNLKTEETHVVSKTPGGGTIPCLSEDCASDEDRRARHLRRRLPHPDRPAGLERSRRRQATGTST